MEFDYFPFKAYGLVHIIIIVLCLALTACAVIFANKIKLKHFYKYLLIMGIVSESLKVIRYITLNENSGGFGYLSKTDLPFHLCSIQLIFIAILNFSKNEKLHKFLLSFMLPTCMIGGFAAILLPTSSSKSYLTITIQYFLYHASIMAFAAYLVRQKEVKFTIKDYFNSLKLLALMALFAIYLNAWIVPNDATVMEQHKINFMYVVAPPQSGLPFLNLDHGWLVYFVHYALLAIFFVTLIYIKSIIEAIKNKKNKKEEVND